MDMKSMVTLAVSAALSASLLHSSASACSRILSNVNGHVVVARTMDLYTPDHARIVVYPRGMVREGAVPDGNPARWTSTYGSVTVNSLGIATSDGINEKGLVANLLYLHGTQYEKRDQRQGIANAVWVQYLLDVAATVPEALAAMEKYQVVSITAAGREWPLHVSISDASGDSAVIEFVNGIKVVHRGNDSAIMTNEPSLDWQLGNLKKYRYFGGTDVLPGDIDPASRFVRASAFLKTMPAPKTSADALESVYSIIKTVSVPQGAHNTAVGLESEDNWPTLWTSLADSVNRLYFYQSAGSPNMFWIDLGKISFAKGTPVRSLPGDDMSLNGEVSGKLTVLKK
jgi:penicillin V acylase-like amidase (Ntn superfamily)